MKKLFSLFCACMLIAALCVVSVSAAEPMLKLSKDVYTEGEAVLVTADGDGEKDWIGIYKVGDEPGGPVSQQWCYVKNAKGVELNLTTDGEPGNTCSGTTLPAGSYIAYYLLNDGYETAASLEFKVVKAPSISVEKAVYTEGEDVVITAQGDGEKDWVGIYVKGDQPGAGPVSQQWYYVKNANGTANNVTTNGESGNPYSGQKLPAGEYVAYYLLNDGYEVAASAEFSVVAAETTAPEEDTAPETVAPNPVEETVDEPTTAPQTADLVIMATIVGLCTGAATILSKKKK